jgi:hypothetical protein
MDFIYLSYRKSVCLSCCYYYQSLYYLTEVEYDAEQDENDQHKAKMKEIDRIEQLHKDKEDLGKFKSNQFI